MIPWFVRFTAQLALTSTRAPVVAGLPQPDGTRQRVTTALAWSRAHYNVFENPGMGSDGFYYYILAMARALVGDPDIILADEPTGNLDSSRSHEIMRLLDELNRTRNITIVLVTHEDDIAAYAKRQIRFRDGKIASDTVTRKDDVA
jgi:putative ABC transport system ATP-binding protein